MRHPYCMIANYVVLPQVVMIWTGRALLDKFKHSLDIPLLYLIRRNCQNHPKLESE